MPKVGNKEFGYSPMQMTAAAIESKKTGKPIESKLGEIGGSDFQSKYSSTDASQRNVQTYPGGGKTGYNVSMYEDGGSVDRVSMKERMFKGDASAKEEIENIMLKKAKYEKGGKVTKRDVKKLTKVKVSLKDARDEDVQKAYGTEGKPFKTRRAIKKQAKKKRKRLMKLAKENRLKRGTKNKNQINVYDPNRKEYGSKVKKSKISGKK
tara:strand:- start:93 stop:716 length:624 start_codon:yes stop_codon:yes gene_type:complete